MPDHNCDIRTSRDSRGAFTLIEMLIVVSIVALLASILLPSLSAARQQAQTVVCGSNIRQLALANLMYADENNGRACPGAADFLANLNRWHGARDHPSDPFDPARGLLVPCLGPEGAIRECPAFGHYRTDTAAFELGTGGYGYNNAYIGVTLREPFPGFHTIESDQSGVLINRIRNPVETLMFADAAFAGAGLIEYGFAEPRFHPTTRTRADPSIHFRHRRHANVAWCDGHVDRRPLAFSWSSGLYLTDPARIEIGWFGQRDDNGYFDLR